MKTELTPEDRERIEQFINEYNDKQHWPFTLSDIERKALMIGAEYENKYQRERQANGLKSIENPGHHIKVLKEQIQRMEKEYKELEAERSELQSLLGDILAAHDQFGEITYLVDRIKNSLKK